ncbi:hypothetical protein DMA15_10570 [Streptomyces sp. WAC 01529]|uniref:DUF5336 domain-containing protein n=1 Tax=Streptomyces sp. WAC 01529 TaxID=2203205 RepID=UPI000F6C9EBF|nr:DUF5336 domain-containing protein [Streptomyces sp. WAC 01529]AZM52985.1 hypothetical protein DMA15_10570 [Streptomyces sp. WAC 01529]
MNFRSLTRGDGVVIGAAVLLFIASFLDTFDADGSDSDKLPNAWENGNLLLSVYLLGIIGAALIVVGRAMPQQRKVAGLDLGQLGVAFTIASALSSLGAIFDTDQSYNFFFNSNLGGADSPDAGVGLILGLIGALVLAAAAVATQLVPALKAPLMGAPRPAAPQPYGGQPQGGYGYPGAGAGQPQPGAPYGQPQPGQPQGQSFGGQPQPQAGQTPPPAQAQPSGDFSPFWFAVPVPRPLYAEDGSPTPIAELAPGTWYLAVEQRGQGLVAQTQDGRRGVLQDTTGIQRG